MSPVRAVSAVLLVLGAALIVAGALTLPPSPRRARIRSLFFVAGALQVAGAALVFAGSQE